jgi:mono/diheme cytochrome c family protein
MKKLTIACVAIFMVLNIANVQGQSSTVDFGKQEFDSRCANCHGKDGKGIGWLSYFLMVQPTNLTTLAKKNGGILPMDRIYQSISGEGIPVHGPSDMPAWGKTYKQEAPDIYLGVPYNAELYSRGRILLLIEYINRLQAK